MILFDGGGRRGGLPLDRVLAIARATDAAAPPFSEAPVEGIVFLDGGPTLQIDLSHHWGGARRAGAYSLLIRTDKGPALLRIDGVAAEPRADRPASPVLDEITALVAGHVAAEPARPDRRNAGLDDEDVALLVVEAAGLRVAFPASAVLSVARHQGVSPLRGGEACERMVVVTGEMLAGVSLGHWLNGAPPVEEPWGLVLDGGTRRVAATASIIHGLIRGGRRNLRTVAHRRGAMLCFLDPDHGAIEVLDPAALAGCAPEEGTLARHLPLAPSPIGVVADGHPPSERRQGLETRNGVFARVGPYSCAFPATMAARVLRSADLERLAARGPGALPLLDLGALLGVPDSAKVGRHAVLIGRGGRRPVVVLADEVAPVPREMTWHPLPIVPRAVHELFGAVGRERDACHWLVRSDSPDMARRVAALGAGRPPMWARPPASS